MDPVIEIAARYTGRVMFPYDRQLADALRIAPQTITNVLEVMQQIDHTCDPTDGLKWFNWLYMTVTQAIKAKVDAGTFQDGAWLTELDVQFAALYFGALEGALTGGPCPDCWNAMFQLRNEVSVAKIQFALAGMNAHIDHDLPLAIVSTCKATNTVPQHGAAPYADYTAVNAILDAIVEPAKRTLNVTLAGDSLPAASHVEDMIADWGLADLREMAWNTAQILWSESSLSQEATMTVIDFSTKKINQLLLVPEL